MRGEQKEGVGCCGGLNERGPLRFTDLNAVSQLVNFVEGGIKRSCVLEVGFQVPKTHTRPRLSLFA